MISKATADHYTWGARCDGWRLVAVPDGSVIHERMPPEAAEARHYHRRARQFFFVLSGQAVMEVVGVRETLGPQQGLEVAPGPTACPRAGAKGVGVGHRCAGVVDASRPPPGLPHRIFNESDFDVEFLVISQPTMAGDRILVE